MPVVSKDAQKEMLVDIARGNVAGGRLGQIGSETLWQLEPVHLAGLSEQLALAKG